MVRDSRLRLERHLEVVHRRGQRGGELGRCAVGVPQARAAGSRGVGHTRPGAVDRGRICRVEHHLAGGDRQGQRSGGGVRRPARVGYLDAEREAALHRRRSSKRAVRRQRDPAGQHAAFE